MNTLVIVYVFVTLVFVIFPAYADQTWCEKIEKDTGLTCEQYRIKQMLLELEREIENDDDLTVGEKLQKKHNLNALHELLKTNKAPLSEPKQFSRELQKFQNVIDQENLNYNDLKMIEDFWIKNVLCKSLSDQQCANLKKHILIDKTTFSDALKIIFSDVIQDNSDTNSILGKKSCTESLIVNTDKSSYFVDEDIRISGNVATVLEDYITLRMIHSDTRNLSYAGQYTPNKDGSFVDITPIGPTFQSGNYTILINYQTIECSINFSIESREPVIHYVIHDNVKYPISIHNSKGEINELSIYQHGLSIFLNSTDGISGNMKVDIPRHIIDAQKMNEVDDIWIILADGIEIKYTEEKIKDHRKLSFSIPEDTKSVRIIGTKVVPEFNVVFMILAISISALILISKRNHTVANSWTWYKF